MGSSAVPDRHDVAVFDRIFLAFQSKQAFFLERLHGSVFHEIVVMADFRANEMIGKIGVNHAGGILCIGAARNRPCAALFFADREEGNESEQPIRGADQSLGAGFRQSVIG